MYDKAKAYDRYLLGAVVVVASLVFGLIADRYVTIAKEISKNTEELENQLLNLEEKNKILSDTLDAEQKKNIEFEGAIGQIQDKVGTLDKLANTDKELLQKYSKVYFLNEHYLPDSLISIPPEWLLNAKIDKKIHSKVFAGLINMLNEAKNNGVDIRVVSAYRSFEDQVSLKGSYSVVYGSGANKFSADQGYSEHQLGTTLDFTTEKLAANFTDFDETKGYEWLTKNAYRYGFVLSYPKGNKYYQYEPWHWRFVGKGLATYLHEEGKYFYDLDQRVIDKYLVNIFD